MGTTKYQGYDIAAMSGAMSGAMVGAADGIGGAGVAHAAGHSSAVDVWTADDVVNHDMLVSESCANGSRVATAINPKLVFDHADCAVAAAPARAGA